MSWSCVSGEATNGSDENVTRPTRYLSGSLVEEPLDRLLCGHEARRLDVVGLHRPRDVDGQGDRRLLVGDGALDLGAGERDDREDQRERGERRRQVRAPARLARHDSGEHLDVRVVDGVAGAPPLERAVDQRRERHDQEREQRERPLDPHFAHSACTWTAARTRAGRPARRVALTRTC